MKSIFPYTGILESATVLRRPDPNDRGRTVEAVSFSISASSRFHLAKLAFCVLFWALTPARRRAKQAGVWEANGAPLGSVAFACSTASIQGSKVKNPW